MRQPVLYETVAPFDACSLQLALKSNLPAAAAGIRLQGCIIPIRILELPSRTASMATVQEYQREAGSVMALES